MARDEKHGFGKLASLSEAKRIIMSLVRPLPTRTVPITDALGLALAEEVTSSIDVPHFRKSAMDGFAVRAADTFGASNTRPKTLTVVGEVIAGGRPERAVREGEAMLITTGAAVPEGADAVLMVEYCEREKDTLTYYRPVTPAENIIAVGSDVRRGSVVFRKGTALNPRFLGVLAAAGIGRVRVSAKPTVAILSTGNEIAAPGEGKGLPVGRIYDINSRTLIAAAEELGCRVIDLGVEPDEKERIKAKLEEGIAKADLVVLSGGSSLGTEDMTKEIVEELGEVLVHGIAVKPGKPVIIGACDGKPVLGLPGYPTSALSNFYLLVRPVVEAMQGISTAPRHVQATLSRKVVSTIGRYEFMAVRLEEEREGDGYTAIPVMKGSSAITTLSEADGFLEIGENTEVLNKGQQVRVTLF
ncbi:molybdopterin molybdenumtransferase MoeA [Candidatus Woesearchaeota archaeon]|nr:molybdopterin molybdenumtransferase MoeA [Candidatus Woesearchaeota archaeon]